MANSDYTVRPRSHGFCPVGYLSDDIGPLDSEVTMTGYTSPVADGIRIGMAAMITSVIPVDPYADNVVLLVQGGPNGSTTVQDRSSYGDSVTISDYAAFDDAHQVFGINPIKVTTVQPGVPAFTSTGAGSRFARSSGDKWTIECWIYWELMGNFAPSVPLWQWNNSSGRTFELRFEGNTGNIYLRNGDDPAVLIGNIPANTLAFTQLNVDGNNYTIDINGVEAYAGINSLGVGSSGTQYFYVAAFSTVSSTGSGTRAWVTPLRMTKGVLRPRGSVPTTPFQFPSTAFNQEIVVVTARDGNDLTLGRGCCDTVPATHSAGDAIWFFDDSIGSDELEYAGTATIGVKTLPRVTTGVLPIEHAPPAELTFNLRFARPYPPGLVEVNGVSCFEGPFTLSLADPTLAITWAHRDRVTQQDQLIDHLEADIGPEPGTTYELRVYRQDGALVRTVLGETDTSWSYTLANAIADFSAAGDDYPGYITLCSMRDGLASYQQYRIEFVLESSTDGGGTPPDTTDISLTLTASIPTQPAGAAIAMNLTQLAAAVSPGSAYVSIFYIPLSLLPDPAPIGRTISVGFGMGLSQSIATETVLTYTTTASTSHADIMDALIAQANAATPLSSRGLTAGANAYTGRPGMQISGPVGLKLHSTYDLMQPGLLAPIFSPVNNLLVVEFALGSPVVGTALNQLVTATLSGTPAAGIRFTVTLNGVAFSHVASSGQSLNDIASALAALIDADANYAAAAAGAVITIDGVTSANVFSYAAATEALFAY